VGFLGGGRFGGGFRGGFGVGWFPLGFREPYYPGFRASRGFINNINIRNTTIRNVNVLNSGGGRNFNYGYAHNTRAVTATSRSAFVGGQAVQRSGFHLNEASLRGAEVSNRTSFTPSRQSSFGAANFARTGCAAFFRTKSLGDGAHRAGCRCFAHPGSHDEYQRALSGTTQQQSCDRTGQTSESLAAAERLRNDWPPEPLSQSRPLRRRLRVPQTIA